MRKSSLFFALSLLLPFPASASPGFIWLPKTVDQEEVYLPEGVNVDATDDEKRYQQVLSQLARKFNDTARIQLAFSDKGPVLTLGEEDGSLDKFRDRALGAVYFTLLGNGAKDVFLGEEALSPASFTRDSFLQATPLAKALSSEAKGWVELGQKRLHASAFYAGLEQGDAEIDAALKAAFASAQPSVRLAIVKAIPKFQANKREDWLLAALGDKNVEVKKAALGELPAPPSAKIQKGLEAFVEGDTDNVTRLIAVKILVDAGQKKFERYLLLDQLNAQDKAVVTEAARKLAESKDPKFLQAIMGLSQHPESDIQELSVSLLREAGSHALLVELTQNSEVKKEIQRLAAKALKEDAKDLELAAGLSWLIEFGTQEEASEAIQKLEAKKLKAAYPALGKALSREEAPLREEILLALKNLRAEGQVDALSAHAKGLKDAKEKKATEDTIKSILSESDLGSLLKLGESEDSLLASLAIRAMEKEAQSPKVRAVLERALSSSQGALKAAAAYLLVKSGSEKELEALVPLKDDESPEVRAQVALAFAKLSGDKYNPELLLMLDDRDNSVREAALQSVRQKKVVDAKDKVRFLVANRVPSVRKEAIETLTVLASADDPAILAIYENAIRDEDRDVKMAALVGLSQNTNANVTSYLGLPLLDSRADLELKQRAILALTKVGSTDAVQQLVRGLFDDESEIKLSTLEALEELKSAGSERPLQEFILRETDDGLRAKAESILDLL